MEPQTPASVHPILARLEREHPRAHAALLGYAALPPAERKPAAYAPAVGAALGTLRGWSTRYRWKARLAAYDEATATARLRSVTDRRVVVRDKLVSALPKIVAELYSIAMGLDGERCTTCGRGGAKVTTRAPILLRLVELGGLTPPRRSELDPVDDHDADLEAAGAELSGLTFEQIQEIRVITERGRHGTTEEAHMDHGEAAAVGPASPAGEPAAQDGAG